MKNKTLKRFPQNTLLVNGDAKQHFSSYFYVYWIFSQIQLLILVLVEQRPWRRKKDGGVRL